MLHRPAISHRTVLGYQNSRALNTPDLVAWGKALILSRRLRLRVLAILIVKGGERASDVTLVDDVRGWVDAGAFTVGVQILRGAGFGVDSVALAAGEDAQGVAVGDGCKSEGDEGGLHGCFGLVNWFFLEKV